MRERSNILNVIQRHIERVLDKDWWKCLKDYRYRANKEWRLGYVLEVLMAGALCGCKTLRDVETLSEVYADRVPDTTLHDMLVQIDPEGLKSELAKGVKQALREHELPKEDFPVRITAIDGKYNFNTSKPVNKFSEPIAGGGNGEQYRHMALRAMYVSSETKLYLGQHEIESKGSETGELIEFIDQLQLNYGRTELLEVISVDAGMVSKKNAQELIDRGLNYILAIKGCQPTLFATAQNLFDGVMPSCVTEEVYNGNLVRRKLTRSRSPIIESWGHIQEFWKIETDIIAPHGTILSCDVRFYITSLDPSKLTDKHILAAIRMHWGIENNAHWCFDALWHEDTAPWTSRAMVFVAHLRMIAYNIIQRLKTRRLKAQQNRDLAWKDLFRFFEHALCSWRSIAEANGTALPAFL
jgi:hypothetical protein